MNRSLLFSSLLYKVEQPAVCLYWIRLHSMTTQQIVCSSKKKKKTLLCFHVNCICMICLCHVAYHAEGIIAKLISVVGRRG